MFEITPAQRHALLRVLRKALVHVRSFTGVSVARDHDGGVTPGMWKAANAALNAVHNMPDWLEGSSEFDQDFFVKSLANIDHLFKLAGQKTDFVQTWKSAFEREQP